MTCTAESVFPPRRRAPRGLAGALFTASALLAPSLLAGAAVFNIRDYGASGRRTDDARASIQQAIDAAAKAGGGTVYLPPGLYTLGTLRLRSHIRLEGNDLALAQIPCEVDKSVGAGMVSGAEVKTGTP
jgi:polygalacturonase